MVLTILPFLLFALSISNILYLSVISVLTNWLPSTFEITILHIVCLLLVIIATKKYYGNFKVAKIRNTWLMIIPYLLVTLIRFPLIYPTYDDLAAHLMWGDYANRLWQNANFMPMNFLHYFYLPLDMNYTPFLYTVGLRITIWLFYLLTSIWMVSLYARLSQELKSKTQKGLLTILFVILPFIPHLLGVSGTLMGDYGSLVFCLEALYLFMAKGSDKTFATIMMLAAILMKQSNSVFVAPILIYYAVLNRKQIKWATIASYAIIASLFFVRLYLETGNALSGLFNGIFKSPLYAPGNFAQTLFGPQNILQTLVWPVIGQFGERYAEGIVSTAAKIFFSPIPIIGYGMSIWLFLRKKSAKYGLLVLTYLLWAYLVGYARYYIALNLMALIVIIFDTKPMMLIEKLNNKHVPFILILILFLSMSSLKTDFSWRPYPSIKTRAANAYYLSEYKAGLSLVGRDNWANLARQYQDLFAPYDAVMTLYRGPVTYAGYMGYLNGLPVYDGLNEAQQTNIANSHLLSKVIKVQATKWESHNKIIVVADKPYDQYFPGLKIAQDYNCDLTGLLPRDLYLQREIYFTETVMWTCARK